MYALEVYGEHEVNYRPDQSTCSALYMKYFIVRFEVCSLYIKCITYRIQICFLHEVYFGPA